MKLFLFIFPVLVVNACSSQDSIEVSERNTDKENKVITLLNESENNLLKRVNCPMGYSRIKLDSTSFGNYLRNVPLKNAGESVLYYNGVEKPNNNIYIAVLDQTIGKRDLQQCADACMRLRGEYLFEKEDFENIHFNFLSDHKPRYFKDYAKGDYSYKKFLSYMNYVFAYANTRSLHHELEKVSKIDSILPGDILIQTGNPYGHAMTVMDVAENNDGEKIFLLSQSYMPAQETQVVINPSSEEISPWYKVKEGDIITPEWTFTSEDLHRFPN